MNHPLVTAALLLGFPVAARLENREMLVSGITAGLLGIAVGNYLGIALAWALAP